jgi:hypothetical protein
MKKIFNKKNKIKLIEYNIIYLYIDKIIENIEKEQFAWLI